MRNKKYLLVLRNELCPIMWNGYNDKTYKINNESLSRRRRGCIYGKICGS
jgi:hypothetical protein